MKKFGVSYNVFDDSIELLEKSIVSIRDSVDFISVVWQDVSNFGNPATEPIEDIIQDLLGKKLIDCEYRYAPSFEHNAHYNELTKRNIGFLLSEENGCDYHMGMDSDEFYLKDELKLIKNLYQLENLDGGYCQMITYYKDFEHILDPPEDYYVSLFYKTGGSNCFKYNLETPVLVDPTRRSLANNFKIFKRNEIQMHHASYIRKNIRKKFENSSANVNFVNEVDKLVLHFDKWRNGDKALVAGSPCKAYDLKNVDKYFL